MMVHTGKCDNIFSEFALKDVLHLKQWSPNIFSEKVNYRQLVRKYH